MSLIENAAFIIQIFPKIVGKDGSKQYDRDVLKIMRLLEKRELLIGSLTLHAEDASFGASILEAESIKPCGEVFKDEVFASELNRFLEFLSESGKLALLDRNIKHLVVIDRERNEEGFVIDEKTIVEDQILEFASEYIEKPCRFSIVHLVSMAKFFKKYEFNLKAAADAIVLDRIKGLDQRLEAVVSLFNI